MKKELIRFLKSIPTVAKYVFALVAVGAVSFLFPKTTQFGKAFSEGQTWLYEDLYAQFDFPIQKNTAELAADREQLERDAPRYYEIKLDSIEAKKRHFEAEFEAQLQLIRRDGQMIDVLKNRANYLDVGNRWLTRWLTRGILGDTAMLRNDKNRVINVVRGNTVEQRTIQNLLTVEKINELLTDSLPLTGLREPSFLYTLLQTELTPNLVFNQDLTKKNLSLQLEEMSQVRGMVRKNDLIVRQNGIVDASTYQKLLSYKKQYESGESSGRKFYFVFLGYCLLTGLLVGLLFFYLHTHAADAFGRLRWVFLLLMLMVAFCWILGVTKAAGVMNIFIVPFCIAPIVIKNFYNRELAFLSHLVIVLTATVLVEPSFEFATLQIAAGWVATYTKMETRYWGGFFRSIFFIILVYVVGFLAFRLTEFGSLSGIDWSKLTWMPLNGLLTLLSYPLIPLLGQTFGLTSSIKLSEFLDLSHPLLNELSAKAAGTLQHSIQVAHLCEKAANAIGANALLVRVGALYHDVGKSVNPQYFVENQAGNNPHDQLLPLESAKVIIEHVSEGIKLAQRHGLPEVVINFIRTHHGTTRVEFFYRMYLKENPDGATDAAAFTYTGARPRTREEVILMLADSIEAAAKSLPTKTASGLETLVENIINGKIQSGQLQEANITFAEIETCKKVFVESLKSIYHDRIVYPTG